MPQDGLGRETCSSSVDFVRNGPVVQSNVPGPIPGRDPVSLVDDVPTALLDDISDRLREVCAHLAPEAFATLVLDIARTKLRFQRRAGSIPGLSGLWDPPDSTTLPPDRSGAPTEDAE